MALLNASNPNAGPAVGKHLLWCAPPWCSLLWCALGGLGLLACTANPRSGGDGQHKSEGLPEGGRLPNIVVVLSDDQRYDTLSASGHPFIETPHIDRLAQEGATFLNSFVVTSVCRSSRATLLTGRYTHRTGVTGNDGNIKEPEASVIKRLQQEGYRTAFFGKYHIADCTPPPEFDHWECLAGRFGQGHYVNGNLNVNGVEQPFEGYSTDAVGERASAWIASQGEGPFFALISLKNPHYPLTPPPRHADLYRDAEIILPASAKDNPDTLPSYVREEMTAPAYALALGEHPAEAEPLRGILRDYARMIPSIDDVVGRVEATLSDNGLRETTLLVFTSDNGILLGEHGIIRKKLAYEPSIRVPLVMRLPGHIPPGSRLEAAALNVDLPATFLAAAGVTPEPSLALDGRNLLSLFANPAADWREDWVYIAPYRPKKKPPLLALRTSRWKYIRYTGPANEEELFDLELDPDERNNLARAPASQHQLEIMRERLRAGMRTLELPEKWLNPPRR